MPAWATWPARAVIAAAPLVPPGDRRHPVFVKAVGFGALAGIGALVVASHQLHRQSCSPGDRGDLAETGGGRCAPPAPRSNVIIFGVLPQVFGRFIGGATYQLDSNLRNSTMVGIVGAGGIGGTLFSAFQRFDYDFVATILLPSSA